MNSKFNHETKSHGKIVKTSWKSRVSSRRGVKAIASWFCSLKEASSEGEIKEVIGNTYGLNEKYVREQIRKDYWGTHLGWIDLIGVNSKRTDVAKWKYLASSCSSMKKHKNG